MRRAAGLEFFPYQRHHARKIALDHNTNWPVFGACDHRTATADKPGASVYYTEMWEATLLDPLPEDQPIGWLGDWSRMRY